MLIACFHKRPSIPPRTSEMSLPKERFIPYSHAVWRLFLIAGSAFHFFAIPRHISLPVV
jgi:predicted membrane channel-forming protein YqfA (hemolysin III family)